MPDAVSITTLVAGGAGGVVVALTGGWVRARIERSQQIRDRMLEAADEFATGLQQVSTQLYVLYHHGAADTAEAHTRELQRLAHELDARLARVTLLFGGYDSRAADAAWAASSDALTISRNEAVTLGNGLIVGASEDQLTPARAAIGEAMDTLDDHRLDFADAAWSEAQAPGRWHRLKRARRRLRVARSVRRIPRQTTDAE